jgi:hypothetical protein
MLSSFRHRNDKSKMKHPQHHLGITSWNYQRNRRKARPTRLCYLSGIAIILVTIYLSQP